jgi:chromosome partitioning protein
MAKKIAIINQKGGVGKTTTAVNLATYLAKGGKRVLLLDLDPQGNATSGLGFVKEEVKGCVYNVLIDGISVHRIRKETKHSNLHLAPASINLAAAEVELVSHLAREHKLKASLNESLEDYDYILIDCPPSLGLLTVNGLVAADSVLIPVQAEYYALEGLGQLLTTIKRVRTSLNPHLDLLGVLVTMYDKRTTLSRQVETELKTHFQSKVFETVVPRSIRLAEAPSHGKAISDYDMFSKGATAYKNLAKEVIKRTQAKTAPEAVKGGEKK